MLANRHGVSIVALIRTPIKLPAHALLNQKFDLVLFHCS